MGHWGDLDRHYYNPRERFSFFEIVVAQQTWSALW